MLFQKTGNFKLFSCVSFFIFLGISLKKISQHNKHRRRCECVTYIDGVFYSLPSSQSTETFRISARAFNSISDTGRFWPSSKDSAGTLISIPASCVFGEQLHLFHSLRQPRLSNTLADDVTITQLQLSWLHTAHHEFASTGPSISSS